MNNVRRLAAAALLGTLIVGLSAYSAYGQAMDAELAFERGLAAYQAGNWGEALGMFDAAIKADPDYAPAYHYRGSTLIQLLQPQEAIKSLERARRLDPDAADVNLDLGTAYMKVKRFDDAESAFREEIKRHPDSADAYFSLGYLLVVEKKYADALEPLAKARQLDPELAVLARFYEGSALFAMGRGDEAKAAFKEALGMNPSPAVAEASRKYLAALGQYVRIKKWGVTAAALYQYDTNVITANRDTDFPISINEEEISDQEDSRGVVTLYGYWRFLDQGGWEGRLSYGFYQSFHAEVDQFNLHNHAPELAGLRKFKLGGLDAAAGLKYSASMAFLGTDMDMYSVNHFATPSIWIKWNDILATRFNYRFNIEDFDENEPDRDNLAHTAFIETMLVFWGDKGVFTGTAGFDWEAADDKEYDVTRPWVKVTCGLKLPLEFSTKFTFYYENENHFEDDANRSDDVINAEVLVFRPIWGPINANVNFNYRLNNSTEDAFEYERTIIGGGVMVQF